MTARGCPRGSTRTCTRTWGSRSCGRSSRTTCGGHSRSPVDAERPSRCASRFRTARRTELMRVLIAEDEALIRMDLREMLAEEGHEVVGEARTGLEAVELARTVVPDV